MYRVTRKVLISVVLAVLTVGMAFGQTPETANGVSYILLPMELQDLNGVYRLNSYSPPFGPLPAGTRIFDLKFSNAGIFNGLTVTPESQVYLMGGARESSTYAQVTSAGWLPDVTFDDNSPAYLKLVGETYDAGQISKDITSAMPNRQYDQGTTNYDNDFWDYGHWPILPDFPTGSSLKPNAYKLNLNGVVDSEGKKCNYLFDPPAPSNFRGTMLWNGPAGSGSGKRHPTDTNKVILPNKWGGISYFAMGSRSAPAPHAGKLMDGIDGRPLLTTHDFRLKHEDPQSGLAAPVFSPYWDARYLAVVIKRTYETRQRNLDLYSFLDDSVPPAKAPYKKYPKFETPQAVSAADLKIVDYYSKASGLNDVPGGDLPTNVPVKIEPRVQVLTSTVGRQYTFSPTGKKVGPFSSGEAALKVISKGSTASLEMNATNIRNADYFKKLGLTLESAKKIAVSSRFEVPNEPLAAAPDYVFASIADKFAVQDSWWGIGGVAYEYFASDFQSPGIATLSFQAGHMYRLDYVSDPTPVPQDLGVFPGAIDDIGVDGQGNLYVLYTVLDGANLPAWPAPLGLPVGPDLAPEWPNSAMTGHADFARESPWMRVGKEKPDYEVQTPSEAGDYKDVYFVQRIKKVAKKYSVQSGGTYTLGSGEDWGSVDGGKDLIVRKLVLNGDGKFSWVNDWHHVDSVASRTASIQADFAVVNFAGRPEVVPPPDACSYSVCRDDSAGAGKRVGPGAMISEGDEVTFKVEGYKPYGSDGSRQDLKYVGNLDSIGPTRVNIILPLENRDEDGDGNSGGFPSSMFETSSHKTKIRWHIDLIEGTNPDDSSKVLREFVKDLAPNAGGDFQNFTFKFPQPGNYRVYARIQYRYFDYAELNPQDRPNMLKEHVKNYPSSGEFVTTKKIMYQVQSAANTTANGYITNLSLFNQAFNQGVEPVRETGKTYNFVEGMSPSELKFSFDAQFIRDANRFDPAQPFVTYGGVGVWDYGDKDGHVYNYVGPNEHNDEYNPGWPKPTDTSNQANHGTRVDRAPGDKDLKAIRWRLYLYPDYSGKAVKTTLKNTRDTGLKIAEGDCSTAQVEALATDRQYKVTVQIPDKILPIKLPIDPLSYRVRLELTYPRVRWMEYETGKADQPQYRSIVPDERPLGVVTTVPGNEPGIAYEGMGANSLFVDGDSWYLRPRDVQVFAPTMTPDSPLETVQTTGDPVAPIFAGFEVADNNPNAEFSGFGLKYERPLAMRDPTQKDFQGFVAGNLTRPVTDPPNDPDAFKSSDYRKTAAYMAFINDYGDAGGNSTLFSPGNDYQNWVGSLTYWIEGELKDGYGASEPLNLDDAHQFTTKAADPRMKTSLLTLQRYDNDPPSLRMTIVSQSDNRRWEITLDKPGKDLVPNPKTVGELASSVLSIGAYRLDKVGDEAVYVATQTFELPGSSNVPNLLDSHKDVKFSDILNSSKELLAALPKVRRSSRIMVNVNMADNVDYLPFGAAGLEINEIRTAESPLSLLPHQVPPISLEAGFDKNNAPNYTIPNPRARFTADMPMVVRTDQGLPGKPQVEVRFYVKDAAGNERSITVPIQVIDSTFETRILENKESRQ